MRADLSTKRRGAIRSRMRGLVSRALRAHKGWKGFSRAAAARPIRAFMPTGQTANAAAAGTASQAMPRSEDKLVLSPHAGLEFVSAADRLDAPGKSEADRSAEIDRLVLALTKLTPAVVRATLGGRPVTVTVPDVETAELFLSALEITSRSRATDRLIDIVVQSDRPLTAHAGQAHELH